MTGADISALTDLEASILGGILLRTELLGELPRLEVDDFLDMRHRVVFSAMRNLEAAGTPIDVVTIQAEMVKQGKSDAVGGYPFLGELALRVPTTDNALEYVRQVREASLTRKVLGALESIQAKAARNLLGGSEVLSMALEALSRIDEDEPDEAATIAAIAKRRLKQLDEIAGERASGKRTMTGFPTGVAALDEKIGGAQPGIVTIVAGRPAMGKSGFGLSIADGASAAGFGVHLFSLEDTEDAYADRALARTSGIPAERLRNAELQRGDSGELTRAIVGLRDRRWLVDGRSGISAEEIVRAVRRHRRQNGTNVVIVDYVQLVKRGARLSPHEALTEIVTTLADAAKQDRMAYVVMSQLNRQIESRNDKRPQLSDLRESGSLEERAKCVIGLYRGAYYGKPVRGVDWHEDWQDGRNYEPDNYEHEHTVQLHVLKNSNGRTGAVFAHWDGPTTRVS